MSSFKLHEALIGVWPEHIYPRKKHDDRKVAPSKAELVRITQEFLVCASDREVVAGAMAECALRQRTSFTALKMYVAEYVEANRTSHNTRARKARTPGLRYGPIPRCNRERGYYATHPTQFSALGQHVGAFTRGKTVVDPAAGETTWVRRLLQWHLRTSEVTCMDLSPKANSGVGYCDIRCLQSVQESLSRFQVVATSLPYGRGMQKGVLAQMTRNIVEGLLENPDAETVLVALKMRSQYDSVCRDQRSDVMKKAAVEIKLEPVRYKGFHNKAPYPESWFIFARPGLFDGESQGQRRGSCARTVVYPLTTQGAGAV